MRFIQAAGDSKSLSGKELLQRKCWVTEAKGSQSCTGVGCSREMSKDFIGKEGMMREIVSFMGKTMC